MNRLLKGEDSPYFSSFLPINKPWHSDNFVSYILCEEIMELKFGDYSVRSWKKEDALSISKYANNRKIWLNLRDEFPHPYALDDAKQFIANAQTSQPETF